MWIFVNVSNNYVTNPTWFYYYVVKWRDDMIKTLAAQIKEYKKASIMTPVFMVLEVVFETLIPFLMASIIDDGVEAGNMRHIFFIGAVMIGAALLDSPDLLFCEPG